MEFTLVGAAAIAVAGLYGMLWFEAGRTNAADCTRQLWDVALGAAVAGLLVGRLGAMIIGGTNPITNPGDILIVRSGVDTGIASAAALVTLGLLARSDLWRIVDGVAPAALTGLAGWHLGCLVRDTCLGTPSDLPWAMASAGSDITRHPVETYAAILLIGTALAMVLLKRRFPHPGIIAALTLAAASLGRLATEPMRLTIGGGAEIWYLVGTAAGLGLAGWRWWSGRRSS